GWLVDKYGPRRVVTVGVFIMGLGLIFFGMTDSLWMYYASNIVIALGTGLQGLLVMSVAINHWFRRKRTLAQSLFLLGFSMAGVVGIPILVLVQMNMGWQTSAIGSGLLVWAAGFPAAQLLRTSPEPYGLQPDGDKLDADITPESTDNGKAEDYDFTLREALHTRAFWLVASGWAVGNLGMGAAQVHLYLHLEQGLGLAGITAALVWTVASIANVPSRILGGYFGDKVPKNLLIGGATISVAIAIFVLGIANNLQMAMVYAVLYGIGWGIRTPVMNAMQGEYFGRKSQGVIRGWLQSFTLPLTIAGPILVGYIADIQGTYRNAFMGLSFITLAGAGLIFLAARPKPPLNPER
ncbi:MAG: MFS transporter, partial [Dehalococcoidales bacterium]